MKGKSKVNPKLMKKANKKLIMRYLVETGPHSRLEIAQFTKLANSATWRITDELMKEGLIEQKGFYSATSRKKSSVFGPSRSFALSIIYNVEVLETIVGIGYLDGSWKIVESFPTGTLEDFLKNVEKTLEKLEKGFPIDKERTRVVFSLPGIVDIKEQKLIYAPNLGWRDLNIKEILENRGYSLIVDNDSNFSLLAESFFSKDVKNSSTAFFLYLGEGTGGSILVDNQIVRGKNFAAGEIGHSILVKDEDRSYKETEQFLSISKLIERFEKKKRYGLEGKTLKEKFDSAVRLWFENDEIAVEIFQEFLETLAVILRNIVYFLNPEIVVFGGIVNNIWETFGKIVYKRLSELVPYEILDGIIFRDTIFKNVPPSLPGCNVAAIEQILESLG